MAGAAGLPAHARLRTAADFAGLRDATGRLDTRHFLIRFGPRDGATPRLGLAVSKRVSKNAVERNRIKRLTRESFRHARTRLPALDILVIARTNACNVDNERLRADIDRAWPRLKALKRERARGTIAD